MICPRCGKEIECEACNFEHGILPTEILERLSPEALDEIVKETLESAKLASLSAENEIMEDLPFVEG